LDFLGGHPKPATRGPANGLAEIRTLTETEDYPPAVNVLSEEKKQHVLALADLAGP
jgi:hypothetical protein